MIKHNTISPLDQWLALNRVLKAYKIIGILLGASSIALVALAFFLATSPPIVVVKKHGSQGFGFYYGERRKVPITEPALLDFLKEFVRLRYTWKERNPDLILKNIAPLTTEGLLSKISHNLKKDIKTNKGVLKEAPETIEQVAVNIQPKINEKKAEVSFDRIIRVGGVPIVAPMELEFHLIKGRPTRWNPKGLYVNGITQKEIK